MTKEQLASELNGIEYGEDFPSRLLAAAKAECLLIVYGYSDDNCEFDGAFRDEIGCYDGGEIQFTAAGKVPLMDEVNDALKVLEEQLGARPTLPPLLKIEAVWGENEKAPDGRECSWHYKTDLPHAKFDIMEDGELYCIGIVIDLKELPPA